MRSLTAIFIILISMFLFSGCDSEESSTSGSDWSVETHSNDVPADYDVVFPDNKVLRIDLKFSAEDWQLMLEDMTNLYGEFGSSAGEKEVQPPMDTAMGAVQPPMDTEMGAVQPPMDTEMGTVQPLMDTEMGTVQPLMDRVRPPMDQGGEGGDMLGTDTANPIWRPCTVTFEGKEWKYVGARFKGNSSLKSHWNGGNMKLPFRLNFDKFEDDYTSTKNQRFYGFKKLSLSSNFSDNSFLREKVTADIFREFGVPSAQVTFYELYVDYGEGSKYFGLYSVVEIIDDPILETQFSDDNGNLYKPTSKLSQFSEDEFDKETNEEEADFSDVQQLISVLNSENRGAEWRTELENIFDVSGFLRWLAINTAIQSWDTYGLMEHNYYIYNESGLLKWIPWDNNMALGTQVGNKTPLSLGLTEVTEEWPLIRYLMDDEVYREEYISYLKELLAEDSPINPEKMISTYSEVKSMIEPYVMSENIGFASTMSSTADFETAYQFLNEHIVNRNSALESFLSE